MSTWDTSLLLELSMRFVLQGTQKEAYLCNVTKCFSCMCLYIRLKADKIYHVILYEVSHYKTTVCIFYFFIPGPSCSAVTVLLNFLCHVALVLIWASQWQLEQTLPISTDSSWGDAVSDFKVSGLTLTVSPKYSRGVSLHMKAVGVFLACSQGAECMQSLTSISKREQRHFIV